MERPFRHHGASVFIFLQRPRNTGRVTFTIKEFGDFTRTIKDAKIGQRAYLDGPYGAFSVDREKGAGYVFLAGGVGITPIMSTLRALAERGDRRPLLFIYGSKTWEDVTFREEIEELKPRLDLTVVHVLSKAPEGWTGESGRISYELLERHIPKDRNSREYMICGADRMMDAVEAALSKLGVSLEHIHSERYNFV